MKQAILNALSALNISDYSMTEQQRSSAELFFIKKRLDMRRVKDTHEYSVTVYNVFEEDGKKFRGSSTVILFPGTEAAEITHQLEDAYNAAGYVKNPYYDLYEGPKEAVKEVPSTLSAHTLSQNAELMAAALFAADTRDDAWLNSAEIFACRDHISIFASTGTDVSYVKYSCKGEFVAQAKEPQDVEQYFSFTYNDLDTDALADKVRHALNAVCDRAHATDCPEAGTYDVVLSDRHMATLMDLYVTRSRAAMIYPHYSDWEIGTAAQGEITTGEALNITLMPHVPYSPEGIPMRERTLLKDGTVQCIHGTTRFCRYLGIEPTGDYFNTKLDNGTVSFDELKKGCLYPASFSDFQMDPMDGHFGGEIRLA